MSSFYAIYHGPDGLKEIALRVHQKAKVVAHNLTANGFKLVENTFFDTLVVEVTDANLIHKKALERKFNFRKISNNLIGLSFDETTTDEDVKTILNLFSEDTSMSKNVEDVVPDNLKRKSLYLTCLLYTSPSPRD